MILINLLPHREWARKRAKDSYNAQLFLAAVVGLLLAGLIYMGYGVMIDQQNSRNAFLTQANQKLDDQIKEVASLQGDIAALKARQQAVEDLQANRNMPVHLLNDAVSRLPEGLYLTGIKQDGQNVLLTGKAQSNERVAELLRNLNASEWLTSPQLIEIQSDQLALSQRDQRRVYNFTVRASLPAAASASAASAATPAAKRK